MMMVFVPVPSQTKMRGARADLGREFKATRKGSVHFAKVGKNHRSSEKNKLKNSTRKKLTSVSYKVVPACRKKVWSMMRDQKHFIIPLGEEKKKESIHLKVALISHSNRNTNRMIKRERVIM